MRIWSLKSCRRLLSMGIRKQVRPWKLSVPGLLGEIPGVRAVFHGRKTDAVDSLLLIRGQEAQCLIKRQAVGRRIQRDCPARKIPEQLPEQLGAHAFSVIAAFDKEKADVPFLGRIPIWPINVCPSKAP